MYYYLYYFLCYNFNDDDYSLIEFEWSDEKEKINIEKHGLNFSIAALVFGDNNRIERFDYSHSINEERYITIGRIKSTTTILFIVFSYINGKIRIISARKANKREEEVYYENQ